MRTIDYKKRVETCTHCVHLDGLLCGCTSENIRKMARDASVVCPEGLWVVEKKVLPVRKQKSKPSPKERQDRRKKRARIIAERMQCVHRGDRIRSELCSSCVGKVMIFVNECAIHKECQLSNKLNVKSCLKCVEFTNSPALPALQQNECHPRSFQTKIEPPLSPRTESRTS